MVDQNPARSVLITGCTPGGIGHALARQFHAQGLHVIATARSRDAIIDLEEMGMSTLSLEVTSVESIERARAEVEKLTGGTLDILVNNAGRNCTVPGSEVTLDEVRLTFETNLFSVIAITQAFTPFLIRSKGLVLNIGSVAAIIPYVFGSVYNASKAALHAYSNTLRLELEPFGVRVLVVVTGGIQSRITRTRRTLAEGSLYLDISDAYEKRVAHSQDGAMPNQVYARGVVREALKPVWRQKKWYWKGNMAFLTWFASRILGMWTFDLVLPRMFGLARLKKIIASREKMVKK